MSSIEGIVLDRLHPDLTHGNGHMRPSWSSHQETEAGEGLDADVLVCACGSRSELYLRRRAGEEGDRPPKSASPRDEFGHFA